MKFVLFYIIVVFSLLPFVRAQNCQSEFRQTALVLSKNKISKVYVFLVDTANGNKKLNKELFVSRDGRIHTVNIHDAEPDTFYYRKTCFCEKDSSRCGIATHIIGKKGTVTPLDSIQHFYNESRKLIKYIDETFHVDHSRGTTLFDPNDTAYFDGDLYVFSDNDTIKYERRIETGSTSNRVVKEKTNGKWDERSWYASFQNGKLIEFKEFHNGKLISSINPSEEDPKQPMTDPEKVPEVITILEYTDTIKNSRQSPFKKFSVKRLSQVKSTKTFIQVSHFSDAEKKRLSFTEFFYSNDLPALIYQPGVESVEVYEYDSY